MHANVEGNGNVFKFHNTKKAPCHKQSKCSWNIKQTVERKKNTPHKLILCAYSRQWFRCVFCVCVVCMSSSFVPYKNAYTHKIAFSLPCFRYFLCLCVSPVVWSRWDCCCCFSAAAAAAARQSNEKKCIFLWVIIIVCCKKWVCGTRHIPRLKTEKSVAFCHSGHYAVSCFVWM